MPAENQSTLTIKVLHFIVQYVLYDIIMNHSSVGFTSVCIVFKSFHALMLRFSSLSCCRNYVLTSCNPKRHNKELLNAHDVCIAFLWTPGVKALKLTCFQGKEIRGQQRNNAN